jgi:preprotein translocase subunit YajC
MNLVRILIPTVFLLFATPAVCQEAPSSGAAPTATAAPSTDPAAASGARFFSNTLMFMIAGFFGYYLLVTRPMVQKEESHKKFLEALKKNDQVLVANGILGKVAQIEGEEITVEVGGGAKLRVLSRALEAVPQKALPQKAN